MVTMKTGQYYLCLVCANISVKPEIYDAGAAMKERIAEFTHDMHFTGDVVSHDYCDCCGTFITDAYVFEMNTGDTYIPKHDYYSELLATDYLSIVYAAWYENGTTTHGYVGNSRHHYLSKQFQGIANR